MKREKELNNAKEKKKEFERKNAKIVEKCEREKDFERKNVKKS